MTSGGFPRWALVPTALALALLGVPLIGLLVRADWARLPSLLASQRSLDALSLSLGTCLVSTALALVLGVPTALVLARSCDRWATVARTIVTLPMVLPPVVAGLALLTTLGRRGLLGAPLSGWGIELGFTTLAVVIAQTFVALPFLVISLEGALRARGTDFEAAASFPRLPRAEVRQLPLPPRHRPGRHPSAVPPGGAGARTTWSNPIGRPPATPGAHG